MASKSPSDYLKEPYARVIVPEEGGGYSAEILEFPGCLASGETPAEAYESLESVAQEWIEAELKSGREIPSPSDAESFGGKFALRMPRGLHQQAARMAERDGTSLNSYIVTAIAARVGADDLFNRMSKKLGTYQANYFFMQPLPAGDFATLTSIPFIKIEGKVEASSVCNSPLRIR